MTKSKKEDKALYFTSDYSRPIKPVNLRKVSRSVQLHVEKIEEAMAKSVLDLGCGAGGILLALQNAGVEEIHGIDASPEAIELAKKRFDKFGTLEKTSLTVGDIIQFDPPTVDAVSSHSVICCHPTAKLIAYVTGVMLLGIIAGVIPGYNASKITPSEALRYTG